MPHNPTDGSTVPLQAAGRGTSQLAAAILGSWAKAPRPAKEAYESFMRSVALLLGGESASEEVQAVAPAVWDALQDAPAVGSLPAGRGAQKVLAPYK